MTTRRSVRVAAMAVLAAGLGAGPAAAGDFDGTRPFLCAVSTNMECDAAGQCERHIDDGANTVTFIRIDVAAKTVAAGASRRTTLRYVTRIDGQIILQGGESGRGWTATIDEETGRMAAAIVDNDHTFSLFGACTLP